MSPRNFKDTRMLAKMTFFLLLRGGRFDGHDFKKRAIEKGGRGILLFRGRKKATRNDKGN